MNPESVKVDGSRDFLTKQAIVEVAAYYITPQHKYTDAECSPYYGSMQQLPPTCVTYGGREIFRELIEKLIEKMRNSNVNMHVICEPRLYHIYPLFAHISKGAATQHVIEAAQWCSQTLDNANK